MPLLAVDRVMPASIRQMGVANRRESRVMAENVLHLGEFDARLDEVRGLGVAQAVWRNVLLQTAGFDHCPQCFLNTAAIEWCPGGARARQAAVPIGKQQNGIAVALPETAQELVGGRRQRHQAILVALGVADMHRLARAVDVADRQP